MLQGVYFKNYKTDSFGLLIYKTEEEAKQNKENLDYYWNTVEIGNMGEGTYRNFSSRILYYPYSISQVTETEVKDIMKVNCKVFKDNKIVDGLVEVKVINPNEYITIYADEDIIEKSMNAKQVSYSFKNS